MILLLNILFGILVFAFLGLGFAAMAGLIKPQYLSRFGDMFNTRKKIVKKGSASLGALFIMMMVLVAVAPNPSYSVAGPSNFKVIDGAEVSTTSDTYTISGQIDTIDAKFSVVSRNEEQLDEDVRVDDDGTYTHDLRLKRGDNTFVLRAEGFTSVDTSFNIIRQLTQEEKDEIARQKKAEEAAAVKQTEAAAKKAEQKRLAALGTEHKVMRVIDGDTVKVEGSDGSMMNVRLIGIDTPETVHPSKPVQCFGREASNRLKELIDGKTVYLESDDSQGNTDKYDRLLRYINLKDGSNVNKKMIAGGYAFEYTYNTPYKYQTEFKQAEKDARTNKEGLWASSTCDGEVEVQQSAPAPAPTPAPQQTPQPSSSNCDPNYSGGCVPNVSYDLNCSDISFSVRVVGSDPHGFDRDGDSYGCESN